MGTGTEDLKNALTAGNGIALICNLVECPVCRNDIWVEVGQHCGFDAVLDGVVTTECYKCISQIKIVCSDVSITKDVKFMTISEFVDILYTTKPLEKELAKVLDDLTIRKVGNKPTKPRF